jgi:hypothetical protein
LTIISGKENYIMTSNSRRSDRAAPPLAIYEVDVLVEQPTTWRVEARSVPEARHKALNGEGEDISGVVLITGKIVDVRRA